MRLLLITNVFPNPVQPTRGSFNLAMARALAQHHEVRVIAPISWVEEWQARKKGDGVLGRERCAVIDGIEAHYPRYYYPPKAFRGTYGRFLWRSVRHTAWRLLAAQLPDAILAYWAHPDGEVAVHIARLIGVPAIVMVGGSDVLVLTRRPGRRRRILTVLDRADAVLTVSRDLKARLVELGVRPEKVHVVYRGVNQDLFAPGDQVEARRRLGIPIGSSMLLWVGRMVAVKGLDVLIEACARLHDRRGGLRLYLVGDGPQRPWVESQCRARGLSSVVCCVGGRLPEQLPDWYRAADLTVLPSRSEGVPNVLRESLACGTPFVASRVGGIPEIADGTSNRLVPPGDPRALTDAIDQALRERNPGTPIRFEVTGWAESTESLLRVIRPLVAAAQDEERPWWASRGASLARAKAQVPRWGLRQLLRSAMTAGLSRRLFLVRGPARSGSICLTFDDGPHPVHTPRLLDVLKSHGVPATFFVVGRQAERYPDLIRRIAAEGHLVGNHSFYHAELNLLSAPEVRGAVQRTQDLLTRFLGQSPTLYRPPRGKVRISKLLSLWRGGFTIALWNIDPKDYACQSSDELREWFARHPLRGGDIVLMHDRLPYAAEALPDLIAAARDRGLIFTTLTKWTRPRPDSSGHSI